MSNNESGYEGMKVTNRNTGEQFTIGKGDAESAKKKDDQQEAVALHRAQQRVGKKLGTRKGRN